MSIRTRALIFSTFFGSCIAIGLVLVSLTTNQWVVAFPRRLHSNNSSGVVTYGLFYGNKDLNAGFGVRSHPVLMSTFIESEPESMNFWLWLITTLCTGFGLLSSCIAAISSVLKSASSKKPGTMVILFASNICAAVTQVIAFVTWLVQFYQYLSHNVLATEDRRIHHWYSGGLAQLGYSFYMVIISTLVVLVNITILVYAKRYERHSRRRLQPPSEEKNQSAIMLY